MIYFYNFFFLKNFKCETIFKLKHNTKKKLNFFYFEKLSELIERFLKTF